MEWYKSNFGNGQVETDIDRVCMESHKNVMFLSRAVSEGCNHTTVRKQFECYILFAKGFFSL